MTGAPVTFLSMHIVKKSSMPDTRPVLPMLHKFFQLFLLKDSLCFGSDCITTKLKTRNQNVKRKMMPVGESANGSG